MMSVSFRCVFAGMLLLLVLATASRADAQAQIKTTFVNLGSGGQGILYEPVMPGPKSHIGLINIHSFSSYLHHSSCENMASRGYRILCADTRYTKHQDAYKGYEDHAPVIKAAVNYVRALPGVTKLVLVGHSMGAPMMAFYQNVAQNGPKACQGPEKIMPCDAKGLDGLPAADGLILLDPHFGDAVATLTYVDPAVIDEEAPARRDKSLDMFDPANGFDKAHSRASYSPAFRKRFLAAQAAREARLVADAETKWAAIQAGDNGLYGDDMPFIVAGGGAARLWQPDVALLKRTKKPYMLMKGDGSTPTEVLTSVRVPSGKARDALTYASVLPVTVRAFLGAHAIRTTADYDVAADDITGIVWESSATSTPANVRGVTVPLLVMVMSGHYFLQSGEIILENAASRDKTMVADEGAAHVITPCVPCAKTPGQFGDTVKRAYDYVDTWLSARF
jgi:pimeloyl-ACP methyl ester carboxylesterase